MTTGPEEEMQAAGYTPLTPYPGKPGIPWRVQCGTCGGEHALTMYALRAGRPCPNTRPRPRRPERPVPSFITEAVQREQAASKQPPPPDLSPTGIALNVLHDRLLRALEPYPGTAGARWWVECKICAVPLHVTLRALTGGALDDCPHSGYLRETLKAQARKKRTSRAGLPDWVETLREAQPHPEPEDAPPTPETPATAAEQTLARYGFVPWEDYPGNLRAQWRVWCERCLAETTVTLRGILAGQSPCHLFDTPASEEAEKAARSAGFVPEAPYPGLVSAAWTVRCVQCGQLHNYSLTGLREGARCQHRTPGSDYARTLVEEAGFTPEEPYPGGASMRWKLRCTQCGQAHTSASLGAVRGGTRCTHRSPTSADYAAAQVQEAGFTPEGPYPGKASAPWKLRCAQCGQRGTHSLSVVRHGFRCAHISPASADYAVAEVEEAGFTPEEPYPGKASAPWRLRCTRCGRRYAGSLSKARGGFRCAHCAPARAEEAVAEIEEAGFTPVEPYPGKASALWRLRCTRCGRVRTTFTLSAVRDGAECAHRAPITLDFVAAQVEEAGFAPLEPYPGKANTLWKLRCAQCGQQHSRTLSAVRRGFRCVHRNPATAEYVKAALKKAGYVGVDTYPGDIMSAWKKLTCGACGAFRSFLGDEPHRCAHQAPQAGYDRRGTAPRRGPNSACRMVDAEAAQAENGLWDLGYEPLEDYPGVPHAIWRVECRTCRQTVTASLDALRADGCSGCRAQAHSRSLEKELLQAGYAPLEGYPGAIDARWRTQCMTCHEERLVSVPQVRLGQRCDHRRTQKGQES